MYWLKRLHETQVEARGDIEKCLKVYAIDAIQFMVSNVKERNSEILRVYQTLPDGRGCLASR